LVGLGSGSLAWTQEEGAVFESIILFPSPFLPPALNTKRTDAYLGAVTTLMTDGDLDYALGTLAAFDRVAVFDHPAAHALIGELRRLGVETWAILGEDPGAGEGERSPFDSVTACAAFENAYDVIVALDGNTETLCRALGLPAAKLYCPDGRPRPS